MRRLIMCVVSHLFTELQISSADRRCGVRSTAETAPAFHGGLFRVRQLVSVVWTLRQQTNKETKNACPRACVGLQDTKTRPNQAKPGQANNARAPTQMTPIQNPEQPTPPRVRDLVARMTKSTQPRMTHRARTSGNKAPHFRCWQRRPALQMLPSGLRMTKKVLPSPKLTHTAADTSLHQRTPPNASTHTHPCTTYHVLRFKRK